MLRMLPQWNLVQQAAEWLGVSGDNALFLSVLGVLLSAVVG